MFGGGATGRGGAEVEGSREHGGGGDGKLGRFSMGLSCKSCSKSSSFSRRDCDFFDTVAGGMIKILRASQIHTRTHTHTDTDTHTHTHRHTHTHTHTHTPHTHTHTHTLSTGKTQNTKAYWFVTKRTNIF
jgi:hypothetical protein